MSNSVGAAPRSNDARGRVGVITAMLLSILASAFMALAQVGPAAAAPPSGISVYFGYADTLRANPANFPTPWLGQPNVQFDGCMPVGACTYDAAAIRVVNNTFASHTFTIVTRSTNCTFDMWHHNTAVPAGGELIVTQTKSGADHGCTPTNGHFDLSDLGPNGASWVGHCDNSHVIPAVDITVDGGTPFTAKDTGQVLNTGGIDKADCPAGTGGHNESIQWTLAGSVPCTSAVLTLAPPTQTHAVPGTATVQATLTNNCKPPQPLSNVSVKFTVTAGPNAGVTGTGTTNSSGVASFSYPGATVGTDTVIASVTNAVGTFKSNTVSVIWTSPPRMTGRAYDVAATSTVGPIVVTVPPINDTGQVSTTTASDTMKPCIVGISGPLLHAGVLCANVVTALGPPRSAGDADVTDLSTTLPGVPAIVAQAVHAGSQTQCTGSSGNTTIAFLSIGGTSIPVGNNIAPNTTINVGVAKVILNEQLAVPGADQGKTVNAIHVIVNTAVAKADVIVASATSDIHNC